MTWFEHLKYRWKFSRCKTNLEVLRVWTEAMMEYEPMKVTYKNIKEVMKEYQDRHEENCATCKWLGLFMTKRGHYFTCRRDKYMCEKSSLGNWCGDYEEAEDKEWN